MSATTDCDVLVVGGGPVGVATALLLAKEGFSVIVAETAAEIYPLPRAAHIDHEIVRVFQSIGVADEIMSTSKTAGRYDFLTADREVLMRLDTGGAQGPSGWPASNMIHQPSMEVALRARLAATPDAELRAQWTLTALTPGADGVLAHFATPQGARTIHSRYLIGCDGARSTVRDLCSIDLDDLQFDEPWLVIDTIVHDPSRLPDANLQICDPERPTTCVQMGAGRHRWEFMLKPGETPDQVTDPAFIADLLKPWNVEGAVTLERSAVYRFHALVARQWRQDRIFLAGDAAHQTPPFAGQGLCSGIRDGANLAWKLGAVSRGEARDALLDTYQAEREPHIRSVIDLALMMGRMVCILDPVAAAERNKAMLAQRAAGGGPGGAPPSTPLSAGCILAGSPGAGDLFPQPRSPNGQGLDDVLGPGPWLISAETVSHAPGLLALSLQDPKLSPFAEDLQGWLSRRTAAAVLVRPDRYVFGTGDAPALSKAWTIALNLTPLATPK